MRCYSLKIFLKKYFCFFHRSSNMPTSSRTWCTPSMAWRRGRKARNTSLRWSPGERVLERGRKTFLLMLLSFFKIYIFLFFRKPGELAVTAPVYRGVKAHSQVRIQWIFLKTYPWTIFLFFFSFSIPVPPPRPEPQPHPSDARAKAASGVREQVRNFWLFKRKLIMYVFPFDKARWARSSQKILLAF